MAPDFTLPILANPTVAQSREATEANAEFALLKLSDYRGRVVFLDFWQSSCASCRESLSLLSQQKDEFAQRDIDILAVNTDINPRDGLVVLTEHGVNYPVVSDPAAQVAHAYGLQIVPTAYLIARDGTVRGIAEGFRREDLEKLRARLFDLSDESWH